MYNHYISDICCTTHPHGKCLTQNNNPLLVLGVRQLKPQNPPTRNPDQRDLVYKSRDINHNATTSSENYHIRQSKVIGNRAQYAAARKSAIKKKYSKNGTLRPESG